MSERHATAWSEHRRFRFAPGHDELRRPLYFFFFGPELACGDPLSKDEMVGGAFFSCFGFFASRLLRF